MDIEYIEKNTDVLIEYYEEIDSTNNKAKEVAEKNVNEILDIQNKEKKIEILKKDSMKVQLIVAENQTKGKGTNGRTWYSKSGENILMTLIFYPNNSIEEIQGITFSIAEMIKDAIQDLYDISLEIKLPNDLLLNGKKICGILTESSIQNDKINYLLIGIGFNVNQMEFCDDIVNLATSLKKENLGSEFSREEIIIKMINNIKSLIKVT